MWQSYLLQNAGVGDSAKKIGVFFGAEDLQVRGGVSFEPTLAGDLLHQATDLADVAQQGANLGQFESSRQRAFLELC